jgi:hypothetical protein
MYLNDQDTKFLCRNMNERQQIRLTNIQIITYELDWQQLQGIVFTKRLNLPSI